MHVHRLNLVIVDDGAQAGAGEGDFRMRIFLLQQVGMQAGSKGVATEVVEAEQSGEADAAHFAA